MSHLDPEQIDPELDSVLRRNAPAPDPDWVAGLEHKLLPTRAGRVRRLLLLVGPEGGFTADEVARAQAAGASLVGLGPRILRAESAGLVAVALCQHLFGDLGADPHDEGGGA